MSSSKDNKKNSQKKPEISEIEINNDDIINVFFDKSSSQFESQLFLSRKRMLNAENGQNELSELLKMKLKALDMMLLIFSNNKEIMKETDLSYCETLNNLLSISKTDKIYNNSIFSKIKNVTYYLIKNLCANKNGENNSNCTIKFLISLLNIKFDNNYFKQILEVIETNEIILTNFMNELFDKIFKGRNISIKLKEIKFIVKSFILNKKINFMDVLEKLLSYAKKKEEGGCRTTFQLNQIVILLQYVLELLNNNKNLLQKKEELNKKLLKVLNDIFSSIESIIDKEDYDFQNKNKKEVAEKNDIIKRKKVFFGEMNKFIAKLKKYFSNEIIGKDYSEVIEKINNLYKNVINVKYVVASNNSNDKKDKNNKKELNKNKEEKNNDKEEEKKEENNENNSDVENNEKHMEDEEEEDDNSEEEEKNNGIELDEEKDDEVKEKKDKKSKNNKEKKQNNYETNNNKVNSIINYKKTDNINGKSNKKNNKDNKKKAHKNNK